LWRAGTRCVRTGDIANAASAGAMIVAHLTTLEDRHAQIAALEDLRATLESDFQKADIAGPAEERHVAVEDALDQARKTLAVSRHDRRTESNCPEGNNLLQIAG